MSAAREELEDVMVGTFGMPDETVAHLLNAYAHELAEKQRAALEADPGLLEPALIDLIDPEVS